MNQDRWIQLADEIGGKPVRKWSWDWLFKNYRVVARHKNWTLTFYIRHCGDEHFDSNTPNHCTGVRAQFATIDEFRFVVIPRVGLRFLTNLLSKRCENSGLREGSSGSKDCDERFTVFSSEPDRIEKWLEEHDLEQRVLTDPTTDLMVRDDEMGFQSIPARGIHELYVEVDELIPLDELRLLHNLMTRLLDRLFEIGVAGDEQPTSRVNNDSMPIEGGWGKTALAMGIAGMMLPVLGIPFALLAWRMGSSDLRRTDSSEIPWSGRNTARLAKWSGIVGLGIQSSVFVLFFAVWWIVMMR